MDYINRLLTAPAKSFFLFGPRGTGKSTWIRRHFPEALTVNLLNEGVYLDLLADPSLFSQQLNPLSPGETVVIDEVQRLPNLLHEVHRFIEEKKLRFVLCGSSARKLKKSGVNLLAGRALNRSMHPFVPTELGDRFSVADALQWGLLPIVWATTEKRETLLAYAQTYLKEEIQAEALTRNLPGFSRFLPIAALYHGKSINVTNVAREAGVARTTVANYIDILVDTLVCFKVPGYEAKLRVKERKLPKLYWVDPGIVRAIRKRFSTLEPEDHGALFEGLVAQVIRAHQSYSNVCDELFYWGSTESKNVEVDFLLRREDRFIAVEVKSGRRFNSSWCRGLRAIAPLPGLCRRTVVYPEGPVLRTDDGIDVLPFQDFARRLGTDRLWD